MVLVKAFHYSKTSFPTASTRLGRSWPCTSPGVPEQPCGMTSQTQFYEARKEALRRCLEGSSQRHGESLGVEPRAAWNAHSAHNMCTCPSFAKVTMDSELSKPEHVERPHTHMHIDIVHRATASGSRCSCARPHCFRAFGAPFLSFTG